MLLRPSEDEILLVRRQEGAALLLLRPRNDKSALHFSGASDDTLDDDLSRKHDPASAALGSTPTNISRGFITKPDAPWKRAK
eukprot:5729647-Prymnesium_polylepis.1